jgi:hypothetical protein
MKRVQKTGEFNFEYAMKGSRYDFLNDLMRLMKLSYDVFEVPILQKKFASRLQALRRTQFGSQGPIYTLHRNKPAS